MVIDTFSWYILVLDTIWFHFTLFTAKEIRAEPHTTLVYKIYYN